MKTLRISDENHRKLTATLGMLMAETGKLQTYDSTITALLTRSVKLSKEIIIEVEKFINENKHLGYTAKEEFIKEAIRFKLRTLKDEKEYIEIPKEKYEKLNQALKGMDVQFHNAERFLRTQVDQTLKKYEAWLGERQRGNERCRENDNNRDALL